MLGSSKKEWERTVDYIHSDTDTHTNTRLCLMFGGEAVKTTAVVRRGTSRWSSRWFRANSAHRLHHWSSAGLTDTDGNRLLICLVSGLITDTERAEHQLSFAYIFTLCFGRVAESWRVSFRETLQASRNVMPVLCFKHPKQWSIWHLADEYPRFPVFKTSGERVRASLNVAIY